MPSLTLTHSTDVAGALTPAGVRAGADSGDPRIGIHVVAPDAPGNIGVWECAPGGWPVTDRPDTEVCYILDGAATITDHGTGTKNELRAGDLLVLPAGWSGRWDVTTTLRKVYAIF